MNIAQNELVKEQQHPNMPCRFTHIITYNGLVLQVFRIKLVNLFILI